jgi:hypothetical protein
MEGRSAGPVAAPEHIGRGDRGQERNRGDERGWVRSASSPAAGHAQARPRRGAASETEMRRDCGRHPVEDLRAYAPMTRRRAAGTGARAAGGQRGDRRAEF